jgi:hypothetical protein
MAVVGNDNEILLALWTWPGALSRHNVTVFNPITQLPRFRNSGNVKMGSSIGHVRMSESFDLRFAKSFWMISQTISTSMLK